MCNLIGFSEQWIGKIQNWNLKHSEAKDRKLKGNSIKFRWKSPGRWNCVAIHKLISLPSSGIFVWIKYLRMLNPVRVRSKNSHFVLANWKLFLLNLVYWMSALGNSSTRQIQTLNAIRISTNILITLSRTSAAFHSRNSKSILYSQLTNSQIYCLIYSIMYSQKNVKCDIPSLCDRN